MLQPGKHRRHRLFARCPRRPTPRVGRTSRRGPLRMASAVPRWVS